MAKSRSLHLVKLDLVVAAIVEAGGAKAGTTDFRLDAGVDGAAADHAVHVDLRPLLRWSSAAWKYRGRLLLTVSKPYQNAVLSRDGTCL
jgi:hypothetical protein